MTKYRCVTVFIGQKSKRLLDTLTGACGIIITLNTLYLYSDHMLKMKHIAKPNKCQVKDNRSGILLKK